MISGELSKVTVAKSKLDSKLTDIQINGLYSTQERPQISRKNLRFCIVNKLQGDADVAGPSATQNRNPLPLLYLPWEASGRVFVVLMKKEFSRSKRR